MVSAITKLKSIKESPKHTVTITMVMLKKKYMVLSEHVTKGSNLIVGEGEKKVVNNDLSQDLNNKWELNWSADGIWQGRVRGRGTLVERTAPFMVL